MPAEKRWKNGEEWTSEFDLQSEVWQILTCSEKSEQNAKQQLNVSSNKCAHRPISQRRIRNDSAFTQFILSYVEHYQFYPIILPYVLTVVELIVDAVLE